MVTYVVVNMGSSQSVLSPNISKVQSVDTSGDGATRRSLEDKPPPTVSKYGPEVDNCYTMFKRAAGLYPSNNCFGYRPVLADGLGPYEWFSYREIHEKALNLGSGITQLNLPEGSNFGMYSANSIPFQIVTLGMFSQGFTCVPVYDTLGENILQYELNHADIPILFCEAGKLASVAKVAHTSPISHPHLTYIMTTPHPHLSTYPHLSAPSQALMGVRHHPTLLAGSPTVQDTQVRCAADAIRRGGRRGALGV